MEYDARAALYPGADYPKSREQNGVSANRAELLLVDAQELEEEEEVIAEMIQKSVRARK